MSRFLFFKIKYLIKWEMMLSIIGMIRFVHYA